MHDPMITSVLVALRRVIRATDLHSHELARTSGLTTPQLLLLQTIRDRGEVTVGEIAEEMILSQATVTSILDRMELRKFISRTRSGQDKRKVYITLTKQGKNAIRNAPVPLQDAFVSQFRNLKDWEQTMILAALQRVAAMMDAENLDAAPLLDVGTPDR